MPTTPSFHGSWERNPQPEAVHSRDAARADGGLILYGHPHGIWAPLFEACCLSPPEAVLILGDLGLDIPFRQRLAPLPGLMFAG